MKNKLFSLTDMIKLCNDSELSEPYIRYLCGIEPDHQYKHQEIIDVSILLNNILIDPNKLNGFLYSYVVPQLNREFDLLKISETDCLNIELKSGSVTFEKMQRQLRQNIHFLKLLNRNLHAYVFVSSTKMVYSINSDYELVVSSLDELAHSINSMETFEYNNLDDVFTPNNILVSPLNATDRFLKGDYLLTENQENIKSAVMVSIANTTKWHFAGITGGPGTGKTLVIYDIAREISKTKKVLLVHSGILCDGHIKLNQQLKGVRIIPAKELRWREIRDVDIVIVDEAHRLYTDSLEKIERWTKREKTTCLFSYDAGQTLSSSEKRRKIAERIDTICEGNIFRLKNKIRTNKELALFITCLRDLHNYRETYSFPNVKVIYEPNKTEALKRAKKLEKEGYTYISFTPSFYNHELDYQKSEHNTHNVIGQEFEGVCMLLDYSWRYENRRLTGKIHPNPDYLFEQLLYQGLTRVRSKLALVICSKEVLSSVLPLLKNS